MAKRGLPGTSARIIYSKKSVIVNSTWYFSMENRIDALWNLHKGFLGSMDIALLIVASAASDFFIA